MQLFSADATIFFFKLRFFPAQIAQTEEFMFQIVAYRPTEHQYC